MKWDLTYLYKTHEEFEKGLAEAKEVIIQIPSFKGKLNTEEGFLWYFSLSL